MLTLIIIINTMHNSNINYFVFWDNFSRLLINFQYIFHIYLLSNIFFHLLCFLKFMNILAISANNSDRISREENMKNFQKCALTAAASISLTIASIIFSINLAFCSRFIYYLDINHLNIKSSINLSTNEIKDEYNYIVDYVTSPKNLNFKLKHLAFSKEGREHFMEVRAVFRNLSAAFLICIVCFSILAFFLIRKKSFYFFYLSSIMLILTVLIIIIPGILNFTSLFDFLHSIIFKNSFWIFYPDKDPIILMLPEKFFFHCVLYMIFILLCISLLFMYLYHHTKKLSLKVNK